MGLGKTEDLIPQTFASENIGHFIYEFPKGICFVDLETTGLSPIGDEIIEIAIIKITPEGKTKTYQSLIKPKRGIPEKTIEIHGITPDMVADSPSIEEVLPKAIKFIGESPLVAHNAKFDLGFIIFAAHLQNLKLKEIDIICTCYLARKLYPELERHSLNSLCEEFDINNENHHRALNDTWVCLKLFLKLTRSPSFNRRLGMIFNLREYRNLKDFQVPDHISKFTSEIFNQIPLMMKYKGGTIKMDYRPIKPTAVMPMPTGPVLFGLCLISNHNKSFSLKKVKELKLPEDDELENAISKGRNLLEMENKEEKLNQRKNKIL